MADRIDQAVDLDRHLAEIDQLGFTIVEDVVAGDDLPQLRTAVQAAVDDDWDRYRGRPGKEYFISLDLVAHGGPFLKLLENRVVDAVFGAVLGEKWTLYTFTSTMVYPDTDQYTCRIHNDTGRDSNGYPLGALATLALDDFTEDNGTTWFLPGSHRRPDQPSESEFFSQAVRFERPAGSAAFFDPRIWHAGGRNASGAVRHGCTLYGCRSFMRQRLDYPRLIDQAGIDAGDLSPTMRRVLGFDVRVPTSLDEFYVQPEDRLYRPGQG